MSENVNVSVTSIESSQKIARDQSSIDDDLANV